MSQLEESQIKVLSFALNEINKAANWGERSRTVSARQEDYDWLAQELRFLACEYRRDDMEHPRRRFFIANLFEALSRDYTRAGELIRDRS